MKKCASFLLSAAIVAVPLGLLAQDSQVGHGQPEPPAAGIVWAHGQGASNKAKPASSPNLLYHGGPVKHATQATAIFWGPNWANTSFISDKFTGVDAFYSGIGGSSYANTNTEYTDGSGHVSSSVAYGGHLVDLSTAPGNGQRTSVILAEVCKMIDNPQADGYYPVYIDNPRGHSGYCAWHSAGSCGNVTVQFAFFYNLDGDPGCDPDDTSGLHSQGMSALANVSGHELSEAMTDPHLDAWYDSSGAENADKCAWRFGTDLLTLGSSKWKIQGNWSNAAFNAGSGYANSSGQNGCIDGGNYK